MSPLLSKIIKLNNLQVLGIIKTPEEDIYYSLQIKRRSNKVDFSSPFKGSVEEIIALLDFTKPIIVAIDGKGVLNKKIDPKSELDVNWKKNLDLKTIYFTELKTSDYSFISFCRKTTVDEHVVQLQNKGLQIVDLYLGPWTAAIIHPSLKEDVLYSNDSALQFNESEIYEVTKNPAAIKDYFFDNQKLSKYHLPLYGAAIDFFVRQREITRTKPESINEEELLYKKGFEYFGKGMLVTFLIALMASYFLIQHFLGDNARLNQENVYSNQTFKHIKELQDSKEQKLKILNETGHMSKQFLNYYIYELAQSVPSAIQIHRLNIFPVEQEIKQDKEVEVTSDVIFCSGMTSSEISFNQWLIGLKNMKWIKKFEIISLRKDKNNIQQFEIKILLLNV